MSVELFIGVLYEMAGSCLDTLEKLYYWWRVSSFDATHYPRRLP